MTPASSRSAAARYALIYFALYAIYGVASPYLQILLRGLGYGPSAIGFFLGFFEIVGIAGPLVVARAADSRKAYKPVLLASALLILLSLFPLVGLRSPLATVAGIALLALGLKTIVPVMDAAVILALSTGALSTGALSTGALSTGALSTEADHSAPPGGKIRRAKADYGALRAIGSAGFVAMALILQFVPGAGSEKPVSIALWMGAATLAFAAVLFLLPGARAPSAPGSGRGAPKGLAGAWPPVGKRGSATRRRAYNAAFPLGILIIALGRLSMGPIYSFISLYAKESVGWNAVGGLWAIATLSEIPIMAISSSLIARMGAMGAISLGSAAIVARLVIYALFPCPAGLVAGQLLHSLCFGLFHPAAVTFVAQRVAPERRATGMAIYMGFGIGLPTMLGNSLGGLVVEAWGYRTLFGSFAVFALAGLILYAATRRRFREG